MRCGALSTAVPSPALLITADGHRPALMTRYRNSEVDEESEDELLLKQGQTKRFVGTLSSLQLG
jgi:hypothetical protein